MTGQDKRLKVLESKLRDKDAGKVLETIETLRSEVPCNGAVKILADLYNSSGNPVVRKKIQDFLNDLKETALRQEVIDEIRRDHKKETIRMLVSSCWQSGLDYSDYASDFAMVFNAGDYETAIECFTVIEGCASHINRKTKDHIIILLKESLESVLSEKQALTGELVSVLS